MIDVDALLDKAKKSDVYVKCHACKWLATRPPEEREKWEDIIEDRRGTFPQIEKAMAMVLPGTVPSPRAHSLIHHRDGKHRER